MNISCLPLCSEIRLVAVAVSADNATVQAADAVREGVFMASGHYALYRSLDGRHSRAISPVYRHYIGIPTASAS